MFGALTGTLPTGLTLLRLADPKMSSTVAPSYVMGSGASVLPAVVLLGLLPTVVAHPDKLLMWIGILGAYAPIFGGTVVENRRPEIHPAMESLRARNQSPIGTINGTIIR